MTPKQEAKHQAALTTAHHDYERGLHLYAFFKVRNKAISEDLVQDTFIKTWGYLVKGGEVVVMKAFLYHILNNLIVDEYRKHKTVSLDILLEKGFEPKVLNSESPRRLFNLLDGKAALLLIQHLPEKYQKVIRMRYVQDLSLQEISLITGQSKNTIAVQIHRGLERLKSFYEPAA
ncbi:MAG TPA: RNA polymerase sigma factor [Candidatus Paceibacterota bacterium]|nr:RNA polymerase sigma factor [Candidatus Paceibacterota bacterium]